MFSQTIKVVPTPKPQIIHAGEGYDWIDKVIVDGIGEIKPKYNIGDTVQFVCRDALNVLKMFPTVYTGRIIKKNKFFIFDEEMFFVYTINYFNENEKLITIDIYEEDILK